MKLIDESFAGLIDRFASRDPSPGGGSAAAASGALAAALGRMVCELTLGRAKYAEVQDEVAAIAGRLTQRTESLRLLVDEDADAYARVVAAAALPKEMADQRAARETALFEANRDATTAPLKTISECLAAAEDLDRLLRIGNANCRSDAGTAIALANAALMGAYLNVRANLPRLPDEEFRARARKLVDGALMKSGDTIREAFAWLNQNF